MRFISAQCRIPVVEGDMTAVMIGRVRCPSMTRIKITAGVQCCWGLFMTQIRSTASFLICKWRCKVELEAPVEKWSAVGSLSVTYFGPSPYFQLDESLHHDWWSLFTRAGRFHVLSCPFGTDVFSYSTWGLCSFISHWSLHDPFVEFRKFVTQQ